MIGREVACTVAPGFLTPGRIKFLLIFIFKSLIEYEISHLILKYLLEEILYIILIIECKLLLMCHSK